MYQTSGFTGLYMAFSFKFGVDQFAADFQLETPTVTGNQRILVNKRLKFRENFLRRPDGSW